MEQLVVSISQIRAARALLDWSQSDLADNAGLSQTGIARIENGTNTPNTMTLQKIRGALESAGMEFLGTKGVRDTRIDPVLYSNRQILFFARDLLESSNCFIDKYERRHNILEPEEIDYLDALKDFRGGLENLIIVLEGNDAENTYALKSAIGKFTESARKVHAFLETTKIGNSVVALGAANILTGLGCPIIPAALTTFSAIFASRAILK